MMNSDTDSMERKAQHPKDPDYFKKYYQLHNKGVMVECPRCHKHTSKVNLSKHMKRNSCLKVFVTEMVEQVLEDLHISPDSFPESEL
jgi:ribosomal protein S27AE